MKKYKIIIALQILVILSLSGYIFYQSDWYRNWVKVEHYGATLDFIEIV